MYCRKCGRQMGQSKFCRYCGAERSDASANSVPSQPPAETECASSGEPASSVAAVDAATAMPVVAETPSLRKPDAKAAEQQEVESSAAVSWHEAPELDSVSAEEVDSEAENRSKLLDTVIAIAMVAIAILGLAAVIYFSASSYAQDGSRGWDSSSAESDSHGWDNPYEGTWRIDAAYLIDSETFEVEQSGEASGTIEIADYEMFVNAETTSGEKLLSDKASFVKVDANACTYRAEDGAVWIVDEMGDGSGISAICMVDSAEQYLAFGMFYDTE